MQTATRIKAATPTSSTFPSDLVEFAVWFVWRGILDGAHWTDLDRGGVGPTSKLDGIYSHRRFYFKSWRVGRGGSDQYVAGVRPLMNGKRSVCFEHDYNILSEFFSCCFLCIVASDRESSASSTTTVSSISETINISSIKVLHTVVEKMRRYSSITSLNMIQHSFSMHLATGDVWKNTRDGQGMPGYHTRIFHFSRELWPWWGQFLFFFNMNFDPEASFCFFFHKLARYRRHAPPN